MERVSPPKWRHPWTKLVIVQTEPGFKGYEVRLGDHVVAKLDNFLKARLVVRDIERSLSVQKNNGK